MPNEAKPNAPQIILDLVERFERNRAAYKSGNYNETQARREFLDPFFKALGWDMDNQAGYAEDYKDVIHEDAIKTTDGTKAPDYCFRIGGTRKFFLEAKRPAVDIKHDVSPAFQLRRYGFTTKLPLCILSDFEEFAVYDCRFKPVKTDSAAVGRILYIPCTEYATRWPEIAASFSKEAVLKGSFDKYAESSKAKRGTADVDDAFLETIETWRKELAQNLALRNQRLAQRELNFAVQRIIDRIIFLRICEGRGIEDYGRLRTLADGDNIYPRLGKLFEQADDRYNSGLFHFRAEKGRHEAPDELTLKLALDDKLLRDILKNLYYPDSPYVFSALSADVLGQVYEQFLGKVIRLTPAHRAEVDDKPEVKKAGGVYYTPTYIVEYIVQNTVGKLLAGKTPKQAAKLKILDPACGSGSFLLGAYEHLLKWHRDYYVQNDPAKWAKGSQPVLVQTATGSWKLTIAERKRILLDNIYGVDIDAQAVETTKLSLLLKVLEGETSQTIQPELLHTRALPDLGDNIKCGNSLIGPDFYQQQQMPLLDDEERYRVNVFDWHAEFPQVFSRPTTGGELHDAAPGDLDHNYSDGMPLHGSYGKVSYQKLKNKKTAPLPEPEAEGGFDAVIGNPPYIRIQTMKDSQPHEVDFFGQAYPSARQGNYDIYVVFVERGLSLLNKNGKLGFILPNKFFNAQYGQPLREILSGGKHLEHIVHFGDQQIFANATTYTCLLFLGKSSCRSCAVVKATDLKVWRSSGAGEQAKLPAQAFGTTEWNIEVGAKGALRARLPKLGQPLGEVAHIFVGLQTSADRVYVLPERQGLEQGILKPFLTTGGLHRYSPAKRNAWLIFPYNIAAGKANLLESAEVQKKHPRAWNYLVENRAALTARDNGKMRGERWHGYVYPKNLCAMEAPKLIIQVTAKEPTVIFDDSGLYMTGGGAGPFYGIRPLPSVQFDIKYLLGLLNSKFFGWIVRTQSTPLRGGYFKFSKQYIETTPIPQPDKGRHDEMVTLVEQMLALQQNLAAAKTPPEQTSLARQIKAIDQQIDTLVYALYGLTAEEIKLVADGQA